MIGDVSSSWKHRLKLAAIPSTLFAAVVFSFGWKSVSPFASWPIGLLIVLSAPALIPFVVMTIDLGRQQRPRRFGRGPFSPQLPTQRFQWRDVLTSRQAAFVGALGVVVFVSFFVAFAQYRGSPEVVNGELVFTDHGKVVGPATERQAAEARTQQSRMFSGHLMLFGVVGLLARVPPATTPPRNEQLAKEQRP